MAIRYLYTVAVSHISGHFEFIRSPDRMGYYSFIATDSELCKDFRGLLKKLIKQADLTAKTKEVGWRVHVMKIGDRSSTSIHSVDACGSLPPLPNGRIIGWREDDNIRSIKESERKKIKEKKEQLDTLVKRYQKL